MKSKSQLHRLAIQNPSGIAAHVIGLENKVAELEAENAQLKQDAHRTIPIPDLRMEYEKEEESVLDGVERALVEVLAMIRSIK